MTSNSMRSFAFGLIVATALCGLVYFNSSTTVTSKESVEKLSNEEMKNKLASEGYVIYTDKEWNELAEQNEQDKLKDTEKQGNTNKEKIIYRTVLNVSQGMTSIDVGRSLEKAKIIDRARTFSNEVEKRGLSNKLRPGIYEVESGMSMDEILAVIFPK